MRRRTVGRKFTVKFASGFLERDAGLAVLRFKAAFLHHGSPHAGDDRYGMKHVLHRHRPLEVAPERGEVDGQVAITQAIQGWP